MAAQTPYELPFPPQRTRPPRVLNVIYDPPPEEIGAKVDWSDWYLTEEEDMGYSPVQDRNITVFKSSMEMLALERAWERQYVGADQFFAWMEHEPLVRVSPDAYVLDDPPPQPFPDMWETWKPGINPPRFALEIVSKDWKKDYHDNPPKYSKLGARELVIFDPAAAVEERSSPERVALQIYRREEDDSFVRVYAGDGPARSEELDVWLVVRRQGPVALLRLARDPEGIELVPTQEEARQQERSAREEAERQRAEAERQRAEAERQRAEAERQHRAEHAAREEAERKLAEALAKLERLERGDSSD